MIHAQLYHAGQEVVISRRAAEAVLRGAHVFVPGALANPVLILVWHKSFSACRVIITNVYTLKKICFWPCGYIPCHSDNTKTVLSVPLMSLCISGVMACSQDLHEGDLVAVSIAMEAPGTSGYVTRGSVVGSDLIAESTLYIGLYLTSSAAKPGSSIRLSFQ